MLNHLVSAISKQWLRTLDNLDFIANHGVPRHWTLTHWIIWGPLFGLKTYCWKKSNMISARLGGICRQNLYTVQAQKVRCANSDSLYPFFTDHTATNVFFGHDFLFQGFEMIFDIFLSSKRPYRIFINCSGYICLGELPWNDAFMLVYSTSTATSDGNYTASCHHIYDRRQYALNSNVRFDVLSVIFRA